MPSTTSTTPTGNVPPPTPTAPSSGNVARLLTVPVCVVFVMVCFFV